ncbi:protease [Pararhizobium polonicum]|uniref:Protease n=1 Tax=Pararhizobium polonicum TaxID=1612624 RepID=A0A1C7NYE5_9HYPH|nr:M10 family metallopeptidase C-terminal domain-containing protein [Pararhizobium polonicum]OBZ94032.1 protease [Pararhizobium polonicum]
MTGINTTSKTIFDTGNPLIDGVISGYAWNGTSVTYAFPTLASQYAYTDPAELNNNFGAVSTAQKNAALFAMEQSFGTTANDGFSVEGFTKLSFSAGSAATANLRFAQSDEATPTAYAYYPGSYDSAGDIWFSTAYAGTVSDYRKPVAGNYAWHTLIHELGHALGLKHGHETDTFGAVPAGNNSIEYTVMTYNGFVGDTAEGYIYEEFGAPQTFMMADIAALQHMYGADFDTKSGNTVYKWTPTSGQTIIDGEVAISPGANRIFATLWDGGGRDTFDLTAYKTAMTIDLRPGKSSMFSADQLSWLGGGPNDGYARGNIFNALLYHGNTKSLIEDVKAGSGNDRITGNEVANALYGNGGNDTLNGEAGNDTLVGGAGADKLNGGSGTDAASYAGATKGVVASLVTPSANTNDAKGDSYSSIENLTGSSHADKLYGNTGANTLSGGGGNDLLSAGAGNDKLFGGAGADDLYGGSGADRFIFKSATESTVAAAGQDSIFDFLGAQGDRIDISGIDANTKVTGDQAFNFIGTSAFSGKPAELRYVKQASDTYIYGDVNGDKTADFAIHLDDAISLQKGYFIL